MKKTLLQLLLLLLPFVASAQTEPTLYKDFKENVRDLSDSFIWDDQVSIMQVNLDNDEFELIAINNKMNVLWRTTLKGYSISCGKFKGKILAVAATGYSRLKGTNGTYKGYLIDPKTGKPELEKILYEGTGVFYDQVTHYYTTDGSAFKMVVRQSKLKRALFVLVKRPSDYYDTQNLTIVDFNDKLEPLSSFKPVIGAGRVIGTTGNYEGDIFLSIFRNDKNVEVTKYAADKNVPPAILTQEIELRGNGDVKDPSEHIKTFASESDRNVLFFSVMHNNYNKDIQLAVAKLDFNKKTKLMVTEIFDKDHRKELEKGFVKPNKDIEKPHLGSADNMEVRYMKEHNGVLLVAMSSRFYMQGQYAGWAVEMSSVVNGYDMALKLKFQNLIPAEYSYGIGYLPVGYHTEGNNLYVIANQKDGMTSLSAVYGKLDLKTGQWVSMNVLSKKKIKNAASASGANVLWFKDSFVVPYMEPQQGFSGIKYDVTLQQNSY